MAVVENTPALPTDTNGVKHTGLYNPATGNFAHPRANIEIASANFLASASGTGNRTSNTITNPGWRAAIITVNITAVAVSGDLECYVRNAQNNQQLLKATKTSISGATAWSLVIGLGAALPAAGQVFAVGAVPLPYRFDLLLIPISSLSATINAELVLLI